MGVSRRLVLGGALASPVLAQAGTAQAASAAAATGRGHEVWVEVLWTPQVGQMWDQLGATMEAIAPAELTERDGKRGVRLPMSSVQGDPSLAQPAHAAGTGALDGGFVVRSAFTELRITQLEGVVRDEQMSGRCTTNGVEAGLRPLFTWQAAEADISVVPGRAGTPTMLKVSNVPVRPTREALEAFQSFFRSADARSFSTETAVAHVTIHGYYVPANS